MTQPSLFSTATFAAGPSPGSPEQRVIDVLNAADARHPDVGAALSLHMVGMNARLWHAPDLLGRTIATLLERGVIDRVESIDGDARYALANHDAAPAAGSETP